MHIKKIVMTMLCMILTVSGPSFAFASKANDSEFPGRKLYLDVGHIELADLNAKFADVIIVDVRSAYEFETLHIKDARNISINSASFISDMKKLRDANPGKAIVTYCNGKTCMKSYKAARKCQSKGISNVLAFDAGIMDWAKAYPDRAVLLGVSPVDPGKLIAKSTFKQHLIKPKDFMQKAHNQRSLIVDVRDPLQREGVALFMAKEKRASLADKAGLEKHINLAKSRGLPMLIYDEAGKQVRWLMYYLEDRGVKEYYFMEGGAKAYFKEIRSEYMQGGK